MTIQAYHLSDGVPDELTTAARILPDGIEIVRPCCEAVLSLRLDDFRENADCTGADALAASDAPLEPGPVHTPRGARITIDGLS